MRILSMALAGVLVAMPALAESPAGDHAAAWKERREDLRETREEARSGKQAAGPEEAAKAREAVVPPPKADGTE